MRCRLTERDGPPARAHIIPKSFYRFEPEKAKPWMVVQSEVSHRPMRSQVGVYDSTILTIEGERLLSAYDDHACEVLLHRIHQRKPIKGPRGLGGFLLEGVDYRKLKLFFISLLWRAAATSHSLFQRVELSNSFHERARQQILREDPGDPDEFAVVVAAFSDSIDSGFGILDPVRLRFGQVNYYLFYLNHIMVYIKVDQRPAAPPFDGCIMRPEKPLLIVDRGEFRKSKEFPVMRAAALKNREFFPKWWKNQD